MTTATIIPDLTNTAPSRSNVEDFPVDADQFLKDLPAIVDAENTIAQELNSWAIEVETFKNQAAISETNTVSSASTALTQARNAAASMVSLWVSGTTYAVGQIVYSNVDGREYKRITAGAGTTDPSSDPSNWESLGWDYITNYPSVKPTLNLDFANTKILDPRITFARTTGASNPATYVNSSGFITAATNNEPRFDYDPIALTCKGLLIEESRTNLATYSQDFTNGGVTGWGAVNLTPSADTTVSPDGTQNADSLFETATDAQHRLDKATTIAAGAYVFSCFLKTAGSRYASLRIGGLGAYIDLNTGVATNAGATSVTVDVFPNGWYRLSIYVASAALNDTLRINNNGASVGIAPIYAGNPANAIVVWGAQLEAGAFPTSYIPTTTTALTRNADVATMTGTNFSSWYRQDEGTLYEEGSTLKQNTDPNTKFTSSITDGLSNFIMGLRYTTAVNSRVDYAGATQASLVTLNPYQNNAFHKNALAVKQNDFAASTNGLAAVSDSSGTIPTTMNTLSIGLYGTVYLCGHIKRIAYYPVRLANATLQVITQQ